MKHKYAHEARMQWHGYEDMAIDYAHFFMHAFIDNTNQNP